jgi:hypothetical protein
MATETFHLWRQYPTAPYYRWACEVVADPEAPDGYKVLKSDPIVADTAFFHRLSAAMTSEHEALVRRETRGIVAHVAERVGRSHPDHFEHAIRAVKGAILGQSPEYMQRVNAPAGSAS